ncbi:aconitase X swivel domain-containing protein [Brassicibacter mesophilus]|uniref:aconitase X swivel domain-containing protein n=1 Tax=Brassicibacter mesophilus TaxID=745119 RepID=UPI003D23CC65
MEKIFKGRPVLPGNIEGEAVVTHQGLNILATFQKSALRKAKKVISSDQNNKELYNKELTGKIICLPKTIGSTTGGMVLESITKLGIGPKAMLFSEHIDSLAAAGVILADVWVNERIVTIDQLGDEFLQYVKDGQTIEIREDGSVVIK